MTGPHPTLAEEIDAVEWAIVRLDSLKKFLWALELRDEEFDDMRPRLKAAAETLRTWEFARETLK